MPDLSPPTFGNGTVTQCQSIEVHWTVSHRYLLFKVCLADLAFAIAHGKQQGGDYPIRVEAFYQADATAVWKSTGSLPAEAADSNVVEWIANVPAGSIAWITLVDHSGTYKQSSQGTVVAASDDASCLDNSKTAAVVTQTVFMSSGDTDGIGLDDRSLLILAVVFGCLFFAAMAGIVYVFSKMRQMRRTRFKGPRFPIAEEFDSVHGNDSFQEGPEYGSPTYTSAGMSSMPGAASMALLGGGTVNSTVRDSSVTAVGSQFSKEKYARGSRRASGLSDTGSVRSGITEFNDREMSPDTPRSEHNPFLDPPINGTSFVAAGIPTAARSPRTSVIRYPSLGHSTLQRPVLPTVNSHTPTTSSATSMQLFNTNSMGGLRIANDPKQIPTPELSRVNTINTFSSGISRYLDSTDGVSPISPTSLEADSPTTHLIDQSGQPMSSSRSADNHSFVSSTSATGSTADHYASEPHSSKGWLAYKK